MSDTDILEPLNACHDCLEALLELAEAGDWEAFVQKAPKREPLLAAISDDRFLEAVVKAGLTEEMRRRLANIQQINDRTTVLAEATKADIADQLKRQNQRNQAIKAYNR